MILPVVCLAILLSFTACRTVPPLPPADFSTQDWHVQQGQALWKRKPDAPELAGDLLVAMNNKEGRTLVQFTKTPLPLVVAQTTRKSWQIEIPVQKKFYSGHGKPPARLAWFYLPGLLNGAPPPKGWTFKKDENNWELRKGDQESITGFLED